MVMATDLFVGGFHDGTIIAADMAFHRSLLVTVGADETARIWNFESMKCELVHRFPPSENPIGVAIHPSGFQVVVSFKEKVRLYNVFMDKLKMFQEAASKSLKELRFSNSGQYWAAASSINVIVFDTATFSQLLCFQGHMMAVKRIFWGPGDHVLFSAGNDGNVYGWSLESDNRIDIIASSNR
jgi:cilia- and flagella-associated protein 57